MTLVAHLDKSVKPVAKEPADPNLSGDIGVEVQICGCLTADVCKSLVASCKDPSNKGSAICGKPLDMCLTLQSSYSKDVADFMGDIGSKTAKPATTAKVTSKVMSFDPKSK